MSEQGEQDRSERPTPFKLQKARRQGSVARGADLGFLVGLAAFTAYWWVLGDGLVSRIAETSREALALAPGLAAEPEALLAVVGLVVMSLIRPLAFLAGAIFLAVLVFELAQTGFVLSTEPLRMDFSRLNPAAGLKRLFSVRVLVETGKSLLKMAVYSGLGLYALRRAVSLAPTLIDADHLAAALTRAGLGMAAMIVGAAVVFAAIDQLIVRRDFLKRMRMSRREIRRESRDREGDPRLKQRRRQLHREFTKITRSVRNIRGADVLVTNPTHYAVALRYDPIRMEAPLVVSRGAHRIAVRLKRLAFLYGVAIVQSPALARALYRCELDQPVPEALYQPIADLYRALHREAPSSQERGNV